MYNISMDYLVKTESFEGPVHVLLSMIEDRKLHVSEISLAAVTEDFLNFIATHTLSHSQVSAFIVVSSTLLLIKSRSLLPTLELTQEEEESITDLTERLRQYEVIRRYAERLAPMYARNPMFTRTWQDRTPVFAPDPQITFGMFEQLLQGMFAAFPVIEKIPEKAVKVVVKLEAMIDDLRDRIQKGMTLHSRDIMDRYRSASDPAEKREAKVFAVVSFLAILELVKKGIANVMQSESFSDIELSAPINE